MPDFSNSRLLAMVTPQTDWASTLDFAKYERAEGLPAGLLTAVMRAESGGDPSATSQKGAGGLFQLMPKTASYYDVDPYDPLQAVEGATAELGALYRKYNKDLPKTLAAWNWGQGNLDQQGFASAPAETQGFVQRVTAFLGPRSAEAAPPQQPRTYSNDELIRMIMPAAPAQPSPPVTPAREPSRSALGQSGRDFDADFNTRLTPEEERQFQAWKAQYAPRDSGEDYDLRGAFKAGLMPDQTSGHWPDTFKKPNHETFSIESRYAAYGKPGRWVGETFIPPEVSSLVEALPSSPPTSSLGELAWSGPGQRVNTGQSAQPVDLVVNIEKPSTPQPRLPGMPAPSEFAMSGDILNDTSSITPSTGMTPEARAQAQHDVAMHWKSLPAAALSAGLVGGVTAGAARLLPEAAQIALPALGAAANYAARKLNVALDLEEPGVVGDVLSVTMPMLPYATQGVKAGASKITSWTRAGRALTTAEQETADQTANAAAQHAARQQAGVEAAQKRQTTYDLNQRRVEAVEARKQAERAQQVLDAQQEAADATATAQHSYAIEQRMAQAEARAAEQQQVADYTAYQDTVRTHGAAVERVQALPQRYLPQMPARNMTDVQRDLALLEQPTARQQVIERLGATDLNDAVRMLSEEMGTLADAGQRMARPGQAIPPSYAQPQPKLPGQAPGTELQRWIRQQGGMRLEGEELHGEFAALVQRKESGAAGLLNNKSGKSAQQLAEAAQEAGYIPTADKESLLDALRQSVNEGKGIYTQEARAAAQPPPLPGTAPAAVSMPPSAKAPQSASRMLYQRLEEVAGSSPVDLTPTVEVALGLQGQMGQGIPAMQPTRLSRILTDLTEMGDRGSVAQVHSMLKELGPLTRDNDGRIRGAAKQLVGSLQQSLTQSAMEWPETAGARQLLSQANAAYRQEQAVGDLRRILAPGGAVLSHKQGRLTLNPDALLNQVERLAARDPFFKGSFSPETYAALLDDLRSFVGTPALPRQAPPLPGTVPVRDIGSPPPPVQPREIPPLVPRIPTVREMRGRPGDYVPEPFTPPPAVEPTMEGMGPHWQRLFGLGGSGVVESVATGHFPYVSAGILTADMAEYALSRIMLTPQLRPLLRQVIHPQTGQIDPAKLAALAAMVPGLTDELTPAEGGR